MKWILKLLAVLIIHCIFDSFSFSQNVKIQSLKSFKNPIRSGQSYTIPYKLTNLSGKDIKLQLLFSVPGDVQLIGSEKKDIFIKANQTYLHIVSAFIPESIRGGEYLFLLTALDKSKQAIATRPVPFKIENFVDFDIVNNDRFNYVFSGDTIYSDFLIESKSNCNVDIKLTGLKCKVLSDSIITLHPDSIKKVPVMAISKKTKYNQEDYLFQLTGTAIQDKSIKKFGYGKVKVFPRGAGRKSIYLAYPVTISNTFLGTKRDNVFDYGMQAAIEGEGYIDKEQNHYHGFRIIGPNRYGKSVLGNLDEYMMFYRNSLLDIKLGDMTFSCTKLTELARSGRGVDFKVNMSDFVFGGFYLEPRFYSKMKNEYSFNAKYKGAENIILETHYISKKDAETGEQSNLVSLTGHGKIFERIGYEAEFASGMSNFDNNLAFLIKKTYSSRKFRSSFAFLYSTPEFEGYYNGTNSWQGNVSLTLTKKISLTTHLRKDASETRRDTLLAEAPLTKTGQLGVQYKYSKFGSLTFRGGVRAKKDRMPKSKFDFREKNATLSLQQRIGAFGLRSSGDIALTEDLLLDREGFSYQFDTDVELALKKVRMNVLGSYEKSEKFAHNETRQVVFGGGFLYSPGKKSKLSGTFRSSYSIENYYQDRSLIDVNFETKIADNQKLELSANYSLIKRSLDKNDFSVGLKYSLRFNAPIKKRIDVGHLSGKITRKFAKNSEGIILFFNGQVAVTDDAGYFQINAIEPGKYFLIIDRNTLSIDEVPMIKTPIEIEIKKGENNIEFGITKQAVVTVEFNFNKNESSQEESKTNFYDYNKKRQVMIHLTNGINTIKKMVDINKPVVLDHLLPGNWELKVKKSNPKSDFVIARNDYSLSLQPKDDIKLIVEVQPKLRKINFKQQNFKVDIVK